VVILNNKRYREEVNEPYWVMGLYGKVNADSVEQVEMNSKEYQEMMGKTGALREKEELERMQLYFQGHIDGYAYMKKIGMVCKTL
jgi:hypothetical protein